VRRAEVLGRQRSGGFARVQAVLRGFGGEGASPTHVDVIVQIGIIAAWILRRPCGADTPVRVLAALSLPTRGRGARATRAQATIRFLLRRHLHA
jgi:hypothetical protein